jgi:hypothetical protein
MKVFDTEYGNYYGATGLFEANKNGSLNKNKPSYIASPIDAVDKGGMIHDQGYDRLNAVGANSLFNDWGTTPIDEIAYNTWTSFLSKYRTGDMDPVTNQSVTSEERGAAWRGSTLFGMIIHDKKTAISEFIRNNRPDVAYKTSSTRLGNGEYEKMVNYNYGQFLNEYMNKDSQGHYTRKINMWEQDKDKNWIPKAK